MSLVTKAEKGLEVEVAKELNEAAHGSDELKKALESTTNPKIQSMLTAGMADKDLLELNKASSDIEDGLKAPGPMTQGLLNQKANPTSSSIPAGYYAPRYDDKFKK